jgi:hypothetical protein
VKGKIACGGVNVLPESLVNDLEELVLKLRIFAEPLTPLKIAEIGDCLAELAEKVLAEDAVDVSPEIGGIHVEFVTEVVPHNTLNLLK